MLPIYGRRLGSFLIQVLTRNRLSVPTRLSAQGGAQVTMRAGIRNYH